MKSSKSAREIVIKNERIVNFYDTHKNIDPETANLLLIDFMETVFNQLTSTQPNINSQILSFMQDNKNQIESLHNSVNTMQENINKINSDVTSHIMNQFTNFKKDYMDDLNLIINNNFLNTNEKINHIIDKNSEVLINKTTLLINDVIPKNQNILNEQIQHNLKNLYDNITEETEKLKKSINPEKSFADFISSFDSKYSSMLQNIQQPLYSFFTASENRITQNIDLIKDTTTNSLQSQNKLFEDLSDFLSKYNVSSNKGKYGEQNLFNILNSIFPSADIKNTSGQKSSGDFVMQRIDKPTIMFENKDYKNNIDKDEISKFINDANNLNTHAIFISHYSGIAFKQNYQIDINKGNVLIYIQNCEYSPDKIRIAVDIIDNLSQKVSELNANSDDNTIPVEVLDDINQEYQLFISQKESLLLNLRDFQKKMSTLIEDLKMPVLDKYLSPKYAFVKSRSLVCDLCNSFTANNKQSLSAHKRGCKKKLSSETSLPLVIS